MVTEEVWRQIEGFSDYEVSDQGRVKSYRRESRSLPRSMITPTIIGWCSGRYCEVRLWCEGKVSTRKIHQLVLEAFTGPRPLGYEANHKDGNKQNNWHNNLEWITPSENKSHAIRTGLFGPYMSEWSSSAKLSWDDVTSIRALRMNRLSLVKIATKFKINFSTVARIVNWKTWNRKGALRHGI